MLRPAVQLFIAALAVVAAILGRASAPSDIHDQTQPKTIAYTVNIIHHAGEPSHWLLPRQNDEVFATKPPLYNWLAAPVVAMTKGRSEWAHKAPSLAAFAAIAALLFSLGRRLDSDGPAAMVSVLAFAAHYMWFKLGYLARPDALLSLWMILGWMAATKLLGPDAPARAGRWRVLLWTSAGLAGLTKGPAALVVPLFVLVLPWFRPGDGLEPNKSNSRPDRIRGLARRSAAACRITGAAWGVPLMILIPGLWLAAAFAVDFEHTYETLIREEITDRFLGIGDEGTKEGPWDWIRTAPNMPFYFITRFLPGSIVFVVAAIWLLRRGPDRANRRIAAVEEPDLRHWLISTLVYPALVVAFFSVAAGKRADYIASAFAPASLLVGLFLSRLDGRIARRVPWLAPVAAALTLALMTMAEHTVSFAARHRIGEAFTDFARRARPILDNQPHPVAFHHVSGGPIQPLLYRSQPDIEDNLTPLLDSTEGPMWLITQPRRLAGLETRIAASGRRIEKVLESEPATPADGAEPTTVALYRLSPRN